MPKISKVTRADNEYTIDVDRLTIRDLLAFEKARTSGNIEDVMHLFEKCLVLSDGVTIYDLPARHFRPIIDAILGEMAGDKLGN